MTIPGESISLRTRARSLLYSISQAVGKDEACCGHPERRHGEGLGVAGLTYNSSDGLTFNGTGDIFHHRCMEGLDTFLLRGCTHEGRHRCEVNDAHSE